MAGNVISMIETGVASAPDVAALNAMTDPLVMIQRMIPRGGNKREAVNVVNALTGLKAKQILKLQDAVTDASKYPNGGPGLYRFEVTDQQSTAKIVWETRVGGRLGDDDALPPIVASGMALATPRSADANIPIAPDAINLGNGFIFNRLLKLLTVPDGRIFQWDPATQTLPDVGPVFARDARGPSTPIGAAMFGGPAPSSAEVDTLRAELAQVKEASREQARQREMADMREAHRKEIEAVTTRMEMLVEKLTAKPAEDPRVAQLEREIAEQRRQTELRAEFNAKVDSLATLVRESQNKGPDPMVNVLTQMLSDQRSSAAENLRMLQTTMQTQLGAANATALTPEKLLAFVNQLKDSGSGVINEKFVGILSGVMDTMLRVKQAEAVMSGTGGVDWMGIIERLADRAGGAVQAFTQMKSRQAAAETSKNNVETIRLQRRREAEARAAAATKIEQQVIEATPLAPPIEGEAARDALAEQMFPKPTPKAEPAASAAAETPAAPVEATPVRRPMPVQVEKNSPLRKMSLKQLRELYDKIPDEAFFGPFFQVVTQLREALTADANSVSADEVAGHVMESRPQIVDAVQKTGQTPVVVQMLAYGQFVYMFARMVPEMGEVYWQAAATALKAAVEVERAAAVPS